LGGFGKIVRIWEESEDLVILGQFVERGRLW